MNKTETDNALTFIPSKHKYALLEDGTIEPLYYEFNGEKRDFYEDGGNWYFDFDRYNGNQQVLMHLRIKEFLESDVIKL